MRSLNLLVSVWSRPVRRFWWVAILLHGCAGAPIQAVTEPVPTPQHIPVCSGYGCRIIDIVSLSDVEWRAVRALFNPRAPSAADERQKIARAIALIERFVGPKTDTAHDKGGTFPGLFEDGQMDCIDESTNTTFYLRLLVADGLIRWHNVGPDATRGYFLFGWPHTTATVREKSSGDEYVVDSWFFDNGAEPVIIPLKQWRDGWNPPAAAKP
ncbi:MAG: hypothetical protein HY082_05255 [Gammaproteobacteria bacterium]|nr:hypothetical protein [Gammaproteobacteria bacterium]